jgi:hypothetical protein
MQRTCTNRRARLLAVAALLCGYVGCTKGPPVADVTGKLTYNGQPVRYAAVDFRPLDESGRPSLGWTDEEGEYVAQYTLRQPGALIGRHKVSVRVYPAEGEKPIPVPEKFGTNPQVEIEVKPGSNRFDIDLGEQ